MFQSFIYLSKRIFNFWVNTYFMSQFFLSPLVFLTSVSLLRCYDLWACTVLRNFDCSLEFVFSLLLLQPFNFSPVSFACNFQEWGCVILREIDFLLKICWSIPCLHLSWKVHTWIHTGSTIRMLVMFWPHTLHTFTIRLQLVWLRLHRTAPCYAVALLLLRQSFVQQGVVSGTTAGYLTQYFGKAAFGVVSCPETTKR